MQDRTEDRCDRQRIRIQQAVRELRDQKENIWCRGRTAPAFCVKFRLRQSEKIFDRITAALYDNEKERPWTAEEPAVHRLEILTGTASDCAGK